MRKKELKGTAMLLLTAFIWGIAFVAQSDGMNYVGPFTFNCVRMVIGGLVLIPCIFILERMKGSRTEKKVERTNKKYMFIGGILCGIALGAAAALQQIGIQYTTVGKAGFITAMYIIIVPVLGIFFRRKAGVRVWISVIIAVAGLYLLCMSGSLKLGRGDLLVLLCALVFSVHILLIDYFSPKTDGVKMSCIQFLTAGLISAVPMLLFEKPAVSDITAAWLPILYAGVLSCGVAYTLQVIAQKDADPTVASLVLSLESVFSVLAGWVILGQVLSGREILGCVLMFAAIILAQLPSVSKRGA
ncbi:MAG TPA: DMT family transporter [Candidatus Scybalocola faecipullorum]|nr:DMT family transporter [Candidatus Scybalocola faecipullorum]